ncbi:MAG: hypothetical protein IJD53_06840 [Alistipes sp.]|nr:hypothetical protein [Alistipes sp.]
MKTFFKVMLMLALVGGVATSTTGCRNAGKATNDICNSKREQECIKYCCELLGLSTITPQLKEKTLQFICNSLKCCDNIDAYKDLVMAYSALS